MNQLLKPLISFNLKKANYQLMEDGPKKFKFYKENTIYEGFKICDEAKKTLYTLEFTGESVLLRKAADRHVHACIGKEILGERSNGKLRIGIFTSSEKPFGFTLSRTSSCGFKLESSLDNFINSNYSITYVKGNYNINYTEDVSKNIAQFNNKGNGTKEGLLIIKSSVPESNLVAILLTIGVSIYTQKYYKGLITSFESKIGRQKHLFMNYLLPLFTINHSFENEDFLDLSLHV